MLPHDFPPYQIVWCFFRLGYGTILAKLVKKIRQRLVEQLLKPTRSIDYQSVKITNAAEQRGIDVVVYAANLHDTKSGILVTRKVMAQHPWHKAKALKVPNNIGFAFIPPYTPEMNPIEQVWAEIRKRGFKNKAFKTLEEVIDRLQEVIRGLTQSLLKSIVRRGWIIF